MNETSAIQRLREIMRLKHYSLSTEDTYCSWARRFIGFLTTSGYCRTDALSVPSPLASL